MVTSSPIRARVAGGAAAVLATAGIAVGTFALVAPPGPPVALPTVVDDDVVVASGGAATAAGAGTFTLAELAAGDVPPARFDAFWEAELERIRTAPCPATHTGTSVVAAVGATPPDHLGEAYADYVPLLEDAQRDAAERCG